MLLLKLLSVISTGLTGIFAYLIEFKWRDKRTNKFRNARNISVFSFIVSLAASIWLVAKDHYENEEQFLMITTKLDSTKIYSKSINDTLAGVRDTLHTVKRVLIKVDSQMTPFLSMAIKKYPNANTDVALGKFAKEINVIFNQKIENINAPNALIATQNQTGNNTVINPISPAKLTFNEWTIRNETVDRYLKSQTDTIKLPNDRTHSKFVYRNQFKVSYNSIIARDQLTIIYNRTDAVFGSITDDKSKHQSMILLARSGWNNENKFLIIIARPQVGYYILDYYTEGLFINWKNVVSIQ